MLHWPSPELVTVKACAHAHHRQRSFVLMPYHVQIEAWLKQDARCHSTLDPDPGLLLHSLLDSAVAQ